MKECDVVLKRAHTNFGDYEEDMIAEILARLPVKSLMRFRCVCKSWRALISDSYFVKKHFNYAEMGVTESTHKLILTLHPPRSLDLDALTNIKHNNADSVQATLNQLEFPVSEAIPDGFRSVIGSCNGLECVEIGFKVIMLWNPCTGYYRVLPNPPPVRRCMFHGIGYDSATDDYKVVLGFYYGANGAEKMKIHIFALKTGFWRTVKNIKNVGFTTHQGLFLNGALHWLYDCGGCTNILSFDIGTETFQQTIQVPTNDWFSEPFIHRNCLCVCTRPTETDSISIWMMKEYGVEKSWTEVVEFTLDNYVLREEDDDDFREPFKPVYVIENGVALIHELGTREDLILFSNLIKGKRGRKKFKHFVKITEELGFFTVIFRETLVSPEVHTYKTNKLS